MKFGFAFEMNAQVNQFIVGSMFAGSFQPISKWFRSSDPCVMLSQEWVVPMLNSVENAPDVEVGKDYVGGIPSRFIVAEITPTMLAALCRFNTSYGMFESLRLEHEKK